MGVNTQMTATRRCQALGRLSGESDVRDSEEQKFGRDPRCSFEPIAKGEGTDSPGALSGGEMVEARAAMPRSCQRLYLSLHV